MSEASADADALPPLEGGTVPQVLVRFLGDQRGKVHLRGPESRREYGYDAWEPYFWVHEADLAHVRRFPHFEVLEHTRIDPTAEALSRLVEDQVRRQLAQGSPSEEMSRPKARAAGRPPIPDDQLRLLLHLRGHASRPWSIKQLASDHATEAGNPEATIKQRLVRARRRKNLVAGNCPYCRDSFDPVPPTLDE